MKRPSIPTRNFHLLLGRGTFTFGISWLVVLPAGVWAISAIYIPVFGAFLSPVETWAMAIAITLLSGGSLIAHAAAHLWAAQMVGSDSPLHIPLYPLGDAAQVWPAARTTRREALVAGAGPLANLILALLTYLFWNAQLQPYFDLITLFLVFFNGGLAVVNLIPVFPLDGGRLLRVIMWGLLARPALATRLGKRLGLLLAAVLTGWGFVLIAQRARFSWQTGTGTFLFAGLVLLPLLVQPVWQWDRLVPARPLVLSTILVRAPIAGLLIFSMLSITVALAPMNNGLEAPGIAPPVEPMIEVPAAYRHPSAGHFLLTTVVLQTPISVGQWVFGQLSPVVKLVPPERIVPADTTVQEVARRNYRMLDESQTSAIVVGLRLAGYEVALNGLGARVLTVLPESPANYLLQQEDVIIGLNGEAVGTALELIDRLKTQAPQSVVQLQIERNGRTEGVATPLMPPSEPDQPPRIGIMVEDAGFEVQLPFPVKIVPQKIVGGPSAGLMFTLTVYNLVTPEDLTGGRIIAGTGTIDLDGAVGPIGGVQQKVAGAELAGAAYFLSPPENYDEAAAAARRIKVVKVSTAEEAIQFLSGLPPVEK